MAIRMPLSEASPILTRCVLHARATDDEVRSSSRYLQSQGRGVQAIKVRDSQGIKHGSSTEGFWMEWSSEIDDADSTLTCEFPSTILDSEAKTPASRLQFKAFHLLIRIIQPDCFFSRSSGGDPERRHWRLSLQPRISPDKTPSPHEPDRTESPNVFRDSGLRQKPRRVNV